MVLDYTSHSDVMRASKISKSWRFAACRHAQFFHTFMFRFETQQPAHRLPYDWAFSILRQVAQQDGALHLQVDVCASSVLQLHDDEHDALWDELIRLVVGVQPILKRFELKVHSTILCNRFFDALCVHEAPRLESLALSVDVCSMFGWMDHYNALAARQVQDVSIPPTLFARSAPQLRDVRILKGVALPPGVPVVVFGSILTLSTSVPPAGKVQLDSLVPNLRDLHLEPPWQTRAVTILPQSLRTLLIRRSDEKIQMESIAALVSQSNLSRLIAVETTYTWNEDWGEIFDATPFLAGLPDRLALRGEMDNRSGLAEDFALEILISGLVGSEVTRKFRTLDQCNKSGSLMSFRPLIPNLVTVHINHPIVPHFLSLSLEFRSLARLTIDVTSLGTQCFWPVSHGLYGYLVTPCPPGGAYDELSVRCPVFEEFVLVFVPDHPKIYQIVWEDAMDMDAEQLDALCRQLGLHLLQNPKPTLRMVSVEHAKDGQRRRYRDYFSSVLFE